MIAAVILGLHVVAAGYAFWIRKKRGGPTEGVLAVAFVAIIFSVGWTMMTMVTSLLIREDGLAKWMNRDTITLVLLTIAEAVFYFFFLRNADNRDGNPGARGSGNG